MAPTKVLLKQTRAALDAKDFKKAISLAKDVLRADKKNYHAYVFIGVAANSTEDVTHAIQAYEKAIALRPEHALAYKGMVEALTKAVDIPDHQLLLARAHAGLGKYSSQQSSKSLPRAADLLYPLAITDESLRSECVEILHLCKSAENMPQPRVEKSVYRIAHLLAKNVLTSDKRPELSDLQRQPLSSALDECEQRIRATFAPLQHVYVVNVIMTRALLRCIAENDFEANYELLRNANAGEEILELAETDTGARLQSTEVAHFALRDFHLSPFVKKSDTKRSRFVLAAEIFRRSQNLELASNVAGINTIETSKYTGGKTAMSIASCTHAMVYSFLHLQRQEYKRALQTVKEGLRLAETSATLKRQKAIFQLLCGAAFSGDRKYKDSIREYEKAKSLGQQLDIPWIEQAAHYGIVNAAVRGHGRRSRQASTAVEEAAASPDGTFGILECIWTDALGGDIDTIRMEEVTDRAVAHASGSGSAHSDLLWDCGILDSTFIMSPKEIAGRGLTRLGQMLLQQDGMEESSLRRAQQLHMKAAGLFRGYPDPFAHLGYIFENISIEKSDERMALRAMRCYEKAVTIDAAHPLASRRLTRMMLVRGMQREAATVAREASEKNPTARWAHNVVGWVRLARGLYREAAVAFRNALRGRPKLSPRAEETLFGTSVGQTEVDNSLVVDIDSWRGMCASYRAEGKIGPALSCLEKAIALILEPPLEYVTGSVVDLSLIQTSTEMLLSSEKTILLLTQKRTDMAISQMSTLLLDELTPITTKYDLSEAHIYLAAQEWLQGAYATAVQLRERAGELIEVAVEIQKRRFPFLNPECCLKRVGDTWMEVVSDYPSSLSTLIPSTQLVAALRKAKVAYLQAVHYSPWKSKGRMQDVAAVYTRMGTYTGDKKLCKLGLDTLLATDADPGALAIAFLSYASVSDDTTYKQTADGLARRVSQSPHSKKYRVQLPVAIVGGMDENNAHNYADSAIDAVREDPTDWRGWYSVALVREADARQSQWDQSATRSCEEAYREADKLGAGPVAVQGRVRCMVELLRRASDDERLTKPIYLQACLCMSTAARAGLPEPELCRMIVDKFTSESISSAKATLQAKQGDQVTYLYRDAHLFPFLEESRMMEIDA